MEPINTYFFDSYALVELFKGNENYKRFQKAKIVTSYFHLFELYYGLLREHDEEEFIEFFKFLQNFCVELKFEWISKASKLKQIYKKGNMSYADCIGYIIAEELGVKFLTGDKEFKEMENVEFVRK